MSDCTVCCDTFAADFITTIEADAVCYGCVRQMFQDAIQSEDNYPPRWGSQQLHLRDFEEILDTDIAWLFRVKGEEYRIPPADRIYCTNTRQVPSVNTQGNDADQDTGHPNPRPQVEFCGTYVDSIMHPELADEPVTNNLVPKANCMRCQTAYCIVCGEKYEFGGHQCKKSAAQRHEKDAAAFEDLVLGKDYQVCPSTFCKRKIQLKDGFNTMTCNCGQSFCFICGKAADKFHWYKSKEDGGCPKYYHPEDPKARWMDVSPELRQHALNRELKGQLQEFVDGRVNTLEAEKALPRPIATELLADLLYEAKRKVAVLIAELFERNLHLWALFRRQDRESTNGGTQWWHPQQQPGLEFVIERQLRRLSIVLSSLNYGEGLDETVDLLLQIRDEATQAGFRTALDFPGVEEKKDLKTLAKDAVHHLREGRARTSRSDRGRGAYATEEQMRNHLRGVADGHGAQADIRMDARMINEHTTTFDREQRMAARLAKW